MDDENKPDTNIETFENTPLDIQVDRALSLIKPRSTEMLYRRLWNNNPAQLLDKQISEWQMTFRDKLKTEITTLGRNEKRRLSGVDRNYNRKRRLDPTVRERNNNLTRQYMRTKRAKEREENSKKTTAIPVVPTMGASNNLN